MTRIWDISQPLHAAVPVWPGEPAFALHSHAVIGDGCPVNVGAQDFLLAKSLLTNRCREVIAFCVRLSLGY